MSAPPQQQPQAGATQNLQQQQPPPPPDAPPNQNQQAQQGRGGRGRGDGGGRGGGGRNLYQPGRGGRGVNSPQQQQAAPKPISLNPSSGIPYGHVPAYLPGSASLVEELDKRVLVVLRDGKHVIGVS